VQVLEGLKRFLHSHDVTQGHPVGAIRPWPFCCTSPPPHTLHLSILFLLHVSRCEAEVQKSLGRAEEHVLAAFSSASCRLARPLRRLSRPLRRLHATGSGRRKAKNKTT